MAGGRPRIAGLRIPAQNIVIWHERMGKSGDEIAAGQTVTLADVWAALAHSFGHRAEINRDIQEGEEFVKALLQKTPSRLAQKLRERLGHGDSDPVLRR